MGGDMAEPHGRDMLERPCGRRRAPRPEAVSRHTFGPCNRRRCGPTGTSGTSRPTGTARRWRRLRSFARRCGAVRRRVDQVSSQRGTPACRFRRELRSEGDPVLDRRLAGVPVVMHMHGCGFRITTRFATADTGDDPRHARAGQARLSRSASVGRTGCGASRPTARITVIPNAVRSARPHVQPGPDEPVDVVFLGRIGDDKGTFRLLDAWAQLAVTGRHLDDRRRRRGGASTQDESRNFTWKTP